MHDDSILTVKGGGGELCQNWAFATPFDRLDTEMKPQELGIYL